MTIFAVQATGEAAERRLQWQHVLVAEGSADKLKEQLLIAKGYIDLGHTCRNEKE